MSLSLSLSLSLIARVPEQGVLRRGSTDSALAPVCATKNSLRILVANFGSNCQCSAVVFVAESAALHARLLIQVDASIHRAIATAIAHSTLPSITTGR